jgi:dTDP-glucose pyrophosphorylase
MDKKNKIQQEKNGQPKEQKQFVNGVNIENTETIMEIKEKPKIANSNFKKFLDVHSLKGFDEETLRKLQESPKDEFGITHINMMYNKEEDKFFCLLDAPNREAVENHHNKAGVKCEWITEMKTTV